MNSLKTTVAVAALAAFAAPAFAAGPLTSPEELKAMLGDENVAVLDIRSRVEVDAKVKETPANRDFAQGHIPGAVHSDYTKAGWRGEVAQVKAVLPDPAQLEAMIRDLGIDNGDTVVIVAGGASPKALDLGAATRVYWTFKALGHDAVTILDGGHDAWVAAGYEVTTEAATPQKGDFEAELQADMIVDGAMVELAQKNAIELIDARPTNQFLGQAQSSWAKNPGTIETSVNIAAPAVLAEGGKGFRSVDELKAMAAAAGIEPGEESYAFCNTGHHATVTWFAMSELLGQDVKVYDGSIYDWTYVRDGRTVIGTLPEQDG